MSAQINTSHDNNNTASPKQIIKTQTDSQSQAEQEESPAKESKEARETEETKEGQERSQVKQLAVPTKPDAYTVLECGQRQAASSAHLTLRANAETGHCQVLASASHSSGQPDAPVHLDTKKEPIELVRAAQIDSDQAEPRKNRSNQNRNINHSNRLIGKTKEHRLTYFQALLLRRWPLFALSVCAMSSLAFGLLLSGLTVLFLHGAGSECSAELRALTRAQNAPLRPPPGPAEGGPLELGPAALLNGETRWAAALQFAPTESQSASSEKQEARTQFQRLPSSLWPIHYDIYLEPLIAEPHFNFSGWVSMQLTAREPHHRISLHAHELQLSNISLRANEPGLEAPKLVGQRHDKGLQHLILELDAPLEPFKKYTLFIQFSGNLNEDLAGFYKIRYERLGTNETTWIAATQFQATDARRAFPCFDEPLFKATFSIQIKHWKNMTALSNMPIIDRVDSPDGLWVTDSFAKSHRMSTYLVAYAVTNFESRTLGNISVWTRPGFVHTAQYALETASKVLRYYEDFFGIEYPLPKMDMIALPDFNAGAMENWGLITYRETAMLYDPSSSSVSNKQRVAVVVAHELAHQWFGNLVTPKWWDDLWLNEGFASYVEYLGVNHVEPKWRMLDQFVLEEVQSVFKMDGLSSSHQISIPVHNPDEISEIFDHISYAKGASVIRMMSHFLTEPVFKAGLRRYLSALRYSNAEQSDLWAHLTEAGSESGLAVDVGKVMNSWTLQVGFPLVTLSRTYDGSKKASLSQARHRPNSKSVSLSNHSDEQRWEVPISYTWSSEQRWDPSTRLWLHQNESRPVQLSLEAPDDDWLLLNVKQVGYYRVNYDRKNWKLLIEQLIKDHTKIDVTNRAQILDDLFELARGGTVDYGFAMEATKYLKVERDYPPWEAVLSSFSYIDNMLQRTPIYGDWKDYVTKLLAPYYARYMDADWTIRRSTFSAANSSLAQRLQPQQPNGADPNDVIEHYNMVNAISWACQLNDHCIQKAKLIFAQWKASSKNEINPALRYTTYCTAIENGNKDDWDFLWRAYEKEQNSSERDRILRALGCSKEMWILARYLEWTFNKSKLIRRQDGAFVFRMIASNNYGREIAFNFMREKWAVIKEFYGKTSFSIGHLIRSISGSMNTGVELDQLMQFYDSIKNDVGNGKRSFQIAIEEAQTNVIWKNNNYKPIELWLTNTRGF